MYFKLPGLRVDVNKCPLNSNCNLMRVDQANFNISFCNNSIKFSCMILIFAGYIHLCLTNILHGLYFFEIVFLSIVFTNSRKVPEVLPQVSFNASISKYFFFFFVHYIGIIIKGRYSPLGQV